VNSFFKNLPGNKITCNKIDFGKLLFEKKQLSIIFPTDLNEAYELFSYIAYWKEVFHIFHFYFHNNLFNFFQNLAFSENIKYYLYDEFEGFQNSIAVIFDDNFLKSRKMEYFDNSIMIDKKSTGNLEFVPKSKTNLDLIYKFSDFMTLPFNKRKLLMKPTQDRSIFFENENINIVIDIGKSIYLKYLDSMIKIIKQHFSANFYLTNLFYEGKDFINVKNIHRKDIYELFVLANYSDFFLTDDEEIAIIFKDFNVSQIFLGKPNYLDNIKCVHPKNIFELRSIFEDIIPESKKKF